MPSFQKGGNAFNNKKNYGKRKIGQAWKHYLTLKRFSFILLKPMIYLFTQKDVSLLDSWIVNGCHYSRTLEAWLCNTDRNKVQIQDLFNSVYGKEAEQKLFNWRLFFIFCSEVFGYSEGNEWHVSHYLFQKKITKSLL